MSYCLIEQPEDKLYVHYNPNTGTYFVDSKVLGAALFTEREGNKFIDEYLDGSWKTKSIKPETVTRMNRDQEVEYFNRLHQ